jgi:hypothetical protein
MSIFDISSGIGAAAAPAQQAAEQLGDTTQTHAPVASKPLDSNQTQKATGSLSSLAAQLEAEITQNENAANNDGIASSLLIWAITAGAGAATALNAIDSTDGMPELVNALALSWIAASTGSTTVTSGYTGLTGPLATAVQQNATNVGNDLKKLEALMEAADPHGLNNTFTTLLNELSGGGVQKLGSKPVDANTFVAALDALVSKPSSALTAAVKKLATDVNSLNTSEAAYVTSLQSSATPQGDFLLASGISSWASTGPFGGALDAVNAAAKTAESNVATEEQELQKVEQEIKDQPKPKKPAHHHASHSKSSSLFAQLEQQLAPVLARIEGVHTARH